jgi:hypothetical protein
MMLLTLAAGLVLGTAAGQTEADVPNAAGSHPSGSIMVRNVFHLNPPTTATQEQTNPAVPRFFLAGIVTMTGKKALLKAVLQPRRGEPAKEECYMLAEGERKGDLEVLKIDEKAGTVEVTWAGTAIPLNFKDNAVKAAAVTPPSPATLPMPEATLTPMGFYETLWQLGILPERSIGSFRMGGGRDRKLPMEVQAQNQHNPTFPPIPPTSLTSAIEQDQAADRLGAPSTRTPFPPPIRPGPPFLPVYSSTSGYP